MSGKSISLRAYGAVLAALIALTVLTVGISFARLATQWHIAAGISIGAVKACLVLLFFMQALHSPKATWCVITVCIVFILLLLSLTYTDYLTRSMTPFAPGH